MDVSITQVFLPPAVNCLLPKPPKDGMIVQDKPVTGSTTMYGQGWTYECNPPKAPSYERGSCMADGSATEPPVCRGTQTMSVLSFFPFHLFSSFVISYSPNQIKHRIYYNETSVPAF